MFEFELLALTNSGNIILYGPCSELCIVKTEGRERDG